MRHLRTLVACAGVAAALTGCAGQSGRSPTPPATATTAPSTTAPAATPTVSPSPTPSPTQSPTASGSGKPAKHATPARLERNRVKAAVFAMRRLLPKSLPHRHKCASDRCGGIWVQAEKYKSTDRLGMNSVMLVGADVHRTHAIALHGVQQNRRKLPGPGAYRVAVERQKKQGTYTPGQRGRIAVSTVRFGDATGFRQVRHFHYLGENGKPEPENVVLVDYEVAEANVTLDSWVVGPAGSPDNPVSLARQAMTHLIAKLHTR